jgi:hypothetical protein
MKDKELLEFAAKAAGMKVLHDPNGVPRDCTGMHPSMNIFAGKVWNPLTDDGDALRLAVKCGLSVQVGASVFVHGDPDFCDPAYIGVEICESLKTDPYAATRRAIVRAAAEIGKATK